jgi:DNA-binding CsgD family transcriptional regulator
VGRPVDPECYFYLTERELDVVAAILRGRTTYKELAAELHISPKTAQTHLANIFLKTGARNMTDVVLMIARVVDCPVRKLPTIAAGQSMNGEQIRQINEVIGLLSKIVS